MLRGDDEISDVMTSSLVCTDGSDVEVLSDREMSDAMESGAECGAGPLDNRLDNMHISAEQNNVNTNNDVATTSGRSVQPIDAVVHVQNQPKVDETQARLLLEKSESIRSSDSDSDMNQDANQDEELMSVSMTGTFESPTRQSRTQTGTDSPPASGKGNLHQNDFTERSITAALTLHCHWYLVKTNLEDVFRGNDLLPPLIVNKKVLCERKRHTARRVASIRCATLSLGETYPPPTPQAGPG